MNIEREFDEANRRVQIGIERNYIIAMARLEGMTPHEYATKLDQEREQAREESMQASMEAVGAWYRQLHDSIVTAADAFARGWVRAGQ